MRSTVQRLPHPSNRSPILLLGRVVVTSRAGSQDVLLLVFTQMIIFMGLIFIKRWYSFSVENIRDNCISTYFIRKIVTCLRSSNMIIPGVCLWLKIVIKNCFKRFITHKTVVYKLLLCFSIYHLSWSQENVKSNIRQDINGHINQATITTYIN